MTKRPPISIRFPASPCSVGIVLFSRSYHQLDNMASMSQRQKGREGILSTLDGVIQILNLAKDTCGIPPAQIASGPPVPS